MRKNSQTTTTDFIMKISSIEQRISLYIADIKSEPDKYFHGSKTINLICETIPPSDIVGIQMRFYIGCNDATNITPRELEKIAHDQIYYQPNKTIEQLERERRQFIADNKLLGVGHISKYKDKWDGYISLDQDAWLAAHILLCSGKPCYINVLTHRKPRQRDYIIRSFSISTQPDE